MIGRRVKEAFVLLATIGLFQSCSLFKEDKCMECPKWEAPKVETQK